MFFTNGTGTWQEPLNETGYDFPSIYPYSAHSVMLDDNQYTTFDASVKPAWAIYDFGYDEEAAGNGVNHIPDLFLRTQSAPVGTDQLNISISADGFKYHHINNSYLKIVGGEYEIEVDPTMAEAEINYYQYLRIELLTSIIRIDVIETGSTNNPIYDALSTEVGPIYLKDELLPKTAGFVATIDGAIIAIDWNETTRIYEIIWDSWVEERWKLGTNVFDLEMIKKTSRFPAWVDYGDQSYSFDPYDGDIVLDDGGEIASYTADNFFNYKYERNLEFIVSSTNGGLYAYTQSGPDAPPHYDFELKQSKWQIPHMFRSYPPQTGRSPIWWDQYA